MRTESDTETALKAFKLEEAQDRMHSIKWDGLQSLEHVNTYCTCVMIPLSH